jgi:uncharacterized protein YjdB
MANTPNYTATKEDSRPFRTVQDAQGDALDQVALTTQAALAAQTTARARYDGVIVTPATATKAVAATQQFTAVVERGVKNLGVTWSSSNPAKATVNSSTGLATAVQAGTCRIIATSVESGQVTGYADLTVT